MSGGPPGKPRILVLNGSPIPSGNSAGLAGEFVRLSGGVAEAVHLFDEGPAPCRACLVCAGGARCPLPDTESVMDGIMDRAAGADCLVLASPIHFTSLTAPVLSFISRLQPWWYSGTGLLPKRRRVGVLLISGGSEYDAMFRPARSVAAAAFRVLGVDFLGMAGATGTDRTPAVENTGVIEEIKRLTERMGACSNGS